MSTSNVTGSMGLNTLLEELEKLVEDERWVDDTLASMCKPTYNLQFDNTENDRIWLFSESHKSFYPYPHGISIEPMEEYSADEETTYCIIGNDLVKVPSEYIFEIGWN